MMCADAFTLFQEQRTATSAVKHGLDLHTSLLCVWRICIDLQDFREHPHQMLDGRTVLLPQTLQFLFRGVRELSHVSRWVRVALLGASFIRWSAVKAESSSWCKTCRSTSCSSVVKRVRMVW